MKEAFFFITVFLLVIFSGCSQTAGNARMVEGASITFAETEHDYGTMKPGADGTYDFVFTNNGSEPLILNNVRSSCGCTVPEWPKEPIPAGEQGVIKVRYNTNITGAFSKSVSVYTNAIKEPVVLIIRGKVEEADSLI